MLGTIALIGSFAARAVIRLWIDDPLLSDGSVDTIAEKVAVGADAYWAKRRLENQLSSLADRVGKSIFDLVNMEGGKLTEGEKTNILEVSLKALEKNQLTPNGTRLSDRSNSNQDLH